MQRVPESVDFLKAEEEVRALWQKEEVFKKILSLRKGKQRFRYLEGPPTANGYMHVGHARGRTIKDVYLRWKTMQGYDAWRQAGWDCQGLPVELEVERNLHLTSKKEIEDKVGVEKFIALCKELVDTYIEHWRTTSERLGLSLDYDSAYETRRDVYIEVAWQTLKRAHERGMLTEDFKVIPFCPRCETPLSGHEVAQGYGTATDPSIYVKFQLTDKPDHYVLIWTTTPWTLIANEAVAVHPDLTYAYVKVGKEHWLLAEKLVERVMSQLKITEYEVEDKKEGRSLEGTRYNHPFLNEVKAHADHKGSNDHKILLADFVTLEEGTGCVHTAPAHGPDDFQLGKHYDLPVFCPVAQTGKYTEEAGPYAGEFVKEADERILQDLKKRGFLVWSGKIEHTYPFCWRCDTALLYRADKQWFLRADPVRNEMLEANLKVAWKPDWAGKNRFHEWLQNSGDWCVSRSRYWGTPLNIWTCGKCGHRTAIGSKAELEEKAGRLPEEFELHRPWVDRILLRCEKCDGTMRRETPVLDAWYDAGLAHTAGLMNLKDKPALEELFPYEFITEAIDQTRGWFYTLLFTSILLYGKAAYQSVLCQEHILDRDGGKMSKSKGNAVWAKETIEAVGSDPLRLYLLGMSSPWDAVPYRSEDLELYRRKLRILFNIFSFSTTYMMLDNFQPDASNLSNLAVRLTVEDRWILSRTQTILFNATEKLEDQRPDEAVKIILDFAVEDLSREYLRSAKRRVWLEEESPEKQAAYATLYYVLERLLRVLAPFAPHLSEWLYQRLTETEKSSAAGSVHLADWPKPDIEWRDPELEAEIAMVQEVAAVAAGARQKAKLKLRWPISKISVQPRTQESRDAIKKHSELIARAVNARSLQILDPGEEGMEKILHTRPNLRSLGAKFKKQLNPILDVLKQTPPDQLQKTLKEQGRLEIQLPGETRGSVTLTPEDIAFEETSPGYYAEGKGKNANLWIDTRRDRELEAEALAREVIRRIQSMRKDMGLNVEEYISVQVQPEDKEDLALLEDEKSLMKEEVRAGRLTLSTMPEESAPKGNNLTRLWEFDGRQVRIEVSRIEKAKT